MIAMAAMMTRARGTANLRILGICLETVARLCNHYGTMDTNTPAICVFCGSSHGVNPAYSEAATELGALIGQRGYRFVFGGGDVGLMGDSARAAHAAGADVLGVLPTFLRHQEQPLKSAEELIVVPDMQQRKAIMLERSAAFIALPGGLGTLDEIFEVLSTRQLKVHDKPIILLDTEGFYAPLVTLLARVVREGFALRSVENLYTLVKTPAEAMDVIDKALGRTAGQKA
jgi:uncharacterized protein (TIGR00730 family)